MAEVAQPYKSALKAVSDMGETIGNTGLNASGRKVKAVVPLIEIQAKYVYKSMKIADQQAAEVNKELDETIQETIKEQGRIRRNISAKVDELFSLNGKRHSLRNDKQKIENERKEAQRSLDSVESSLTDAEDKLEEQMREQTIVSVVAVIITAIPVVGWIVGLAIVTFAFITLEEKTKSARRSVGMESIRLNIDTKHGQI